MAFIAACPRERPPDPGTGDPDTGDAGLSCSPEPSGGAPWAGACIFPRPVDPCSQLVLPDAGPVPSAEDWAEESSRIRCAAWVAAGTLEPTVESLCVRSEAQKWDGWVAEYQAGYRTYWPEAAWACLTGGRPARCSGLWLRVLARRHGHTVRQQHALPRGLLPQGREWGGNLCPVSAAPAARQHVRRDWAGALREQLILHQWLLRTRGVARGELWRRLRREV